MRAVPTALMTNPRLNMACRRPAQMAFFMFSSLLSALLGNRKAGMADFHSVMPAVDISCINLTVNIPSQDQLRYHQSH